MTRTELIKTVKETDARTSNKWNKLYNCNASYRDIYINGKGYIELRSYSTIVALYSPWTDTIYEFDRYSTTTSQHIYKFANLMRADSITRLYKNSTGILTTNFHWKDYKPSKQEWENVIATDYAIEIESI